MIASGNASYGRPYSPLRSTKVPTTPTFAQRDSFSDIWQALNTCRVSGERERPTNISVTREYYFEEWQDRLRVRPKELGGKQI
ncbi:hypothetical protein L484_011841 [Morus notabilis]|uniref:Uncharacterized protein n=1 Tax=Morus notabilis TaxID=981085 RepID=W9SCC8_9ROSA|nr:hypothetical protein L484_011841 [Morus notabilis]